MALDDGDDVLPEALDEEMVSRHRDRHIMTEFLKWTEFLKCLPGGMGAGAGFVSQARNVAFYGRSATGFSMTQRTT